MRVSEPTARRGHRADGRLRQRRPAVVEGLSVALARPCADGLLRGCAGPGGRAGGRERLGQEPDAALDPWPAAHRRPRHRTHRYGDASLLDLSGARCSACAARASAWCSRTPCPPSTPSCGWATRSPRSIRSHENARQEDRPPAGSGDHGAGRHPGCGGAQLRVSPPVQRRHAPADRRGDGARGEPHAAPGGRAHHRAGRGRPGRHPAPARRPRGGSRA